MKRTSIVLLAAAFVLLSACAKPADSKGQPAGTVQISVTCADILDNMDTFDPEKAALVPKDGVILADTEVDFFEVDTVFDLLSRTLRENDIHLEYEDAGESGVYVKGIANIYTGDGGQASGWLYYINSESPTESCSRLTPADGDRIEWVYVCDFSTLPLS